MLVKVRAALSTLPMIWLLGVSAVHAIDIPATGTQVGGHVKIIVTDPMTGTWTDTNSVNHSGGQNGGFSIPRAYLIISQEIGDFCSIEMMPQFSAEAGATPRLGQKINSMIPVNIVPGFSGWQKLFAKFALPFKTELTAGIMNCRFTNEYSSETWWDEEFHVNKPTHDLGIMEESGIELYRNFEIGKLSLPLYVYLLNSGNNELDEPNQTPLGLIHVEPEIGPFRFTGSIAYEKWDARDSHDEIRWSAGAAYEVGGLSVRGEAMGGIWKNKLMVDSTPIDAKGTGFYLKPFYRYADWGKVGIDISYADLQTSDDCSHEMDLTIAPLLVFTPVTGVSIIDQNEFGFWSRTDANNKSEKLQYFRSTIGVRVTF